MKKKANSAYHGITPTEAMLSAVLVQTSQNKWYRFNLWQDRVLIMDRRLEFRNFQDWLDGWTEGDDTEEDGDLRRMYTRLFDCNPPKNAKLLTVAKAVWCKLYLIAEDRTDVYSQGKKDPVTGARDRKRNLNRREYRVLETYPGWADTLPNQAQVLYHSLHDLTEQVSSDIITEGQVKDMMTRLVEAKTLSTKQDPFRIFQYYRPLLIKLNLLETCK